MRKMIMVLIMAFTMMTGLFADVTLLPEDMFNNYIVSVLFEDTTFVQPQIAYVANTWEDVYEKTGVDKYGWKEDLSTYCDSEQQYFLIIKCEVKGDIGWICLEYPGDGSLVLYTALI